MSNDGSQWTRPSHEFQFPSPRSRTRKPTEGNEREKRHQWDPEVMRKVQLHKQWGRSGPRHYQKISHRRRRSWCRKSEGCTLTKVRTTGGSGVATETTLWGKWEGGRLRVRKVLVRFHRKRPQGKVNGREGGDIRVSRK